MPAKLDPLEAVRRMQKVRPEYGFEDFVYTSSRAKSVVECPSHGKFLAAQDSIMGGHGCPGCKADKSKQTLRKSPEDAVAQLRQHAPIYDFSEFVYKGNKVKGKVVCSTHGAFMASASAILRGRGCPKCGIASRGLKSRIPSEVAVKRMMEKMPELDFSKFKYKSTGSKGTVVCPVHGEFQQTYNHLIMGIGCRSCSIEVLSAQKTIPFDTFLARAQETHAEKYEYDRLTYSGASGKVVARCPLHGPFVIRCFEHVNGQGCPGCKDVRFNPNKRAFLYVYRLISGNDRFVGYGITANLRRRHEEHIRRCAKRGVTAELLHSFRFRKGFWCRHAEAEIARSFPSVDVGVRGFRREASDWNNYSAIYSLAEELHQDFGGASEIFLP